jgi:hypothetical protein
MISQGVAPVRRPKTPSETPFSETVKVTGSVKVKMIPLAIPIITTKRVIVSGKAKKIPLVTPDIMIRINLSPQNVKKISLDMKSAKTNDLPLTLSRKRKN